MLGVIAAGGNGTRLLPCTKFLNKHLMPSGTEQLIIDHPLRLMKEQNFSQVTIVTGSNHASQIVDYVGDGSKHGFTRVEYAFQPSPAGIADVLKRISHNNIDDGVLLILGDNFFSQKQISINTLDKSKAAAFQYEVGFDKAKSFGQVFYKDGRPVDIVEKPQEPQHRSILTGLYYFPADVFYRVNDLTPSQRNELEITDLLKFYLKEDRLEVFKVEGEWADLGEWNSLKQFWSRGV